MDFIPKRRRALSSSFQTFDKGFVKNGEETLRLLESYVVQHSS